AADLIRVHCGEIRAQKTLDYLLIQQKPLHSQDKEKTTLDNPSTYENNMVSKAIAFMSENLSAQVPVSLEPSQVTSSPPFIGRARRDRL
ncbi:hypothetical protein, partial [Vogesella mureinivorans]|uniref:hypothetical protein n=1 Tax=Vogesella mureinivorans TaxID=657276 RepID=UPI00197D1495